VKFFESEPAERVVEDGYWCYEVTAHGASVLRFSLDRHERSVQTELRIQGVTVATISHEMATRLSVDGSDLRCDFLSANSRTTLTIHRSHGYRIVWSTLRTK
jgi:hypothetical protein